MDVSFAMAYCVVSQKSVAAKVIAISSLWSLLVIASACGVMSCKSAVAESPDNSAGDLRIHYTTAPINVSSLPALVRFAADVAYDSYTETRFDIFLPQVNRKVPLVIYIHGGGFVSGDKKDIYSGSPNTIRSVLGAEFAFATINYRFIENADNVGVLKSLGDSKRCLQFIRHHAAALNIDTDRILLMGGSAGAGTALWLALSPDMKDSSLSDTVGRQSTRVRGAVAIETQATYDLPKWESIFAVYGFRLSSLENTVLPFYAISSLSQLTLPAIVHYRKSVDLLDLMSSDDPEIWVTNKSINEVNPNGNTNILFHHPYHVKALRDRALAVGGMRGRFYIPALGISDTSDEGMLDFIVRKLQ